MQQSRNLRFFDVIVGLFVSILLISNIASTKIVEIWRFTFDGGTILFPLSYIFGDILTEVYGYRKSRKVIWIGFFCAVLMSLVLGVIGILKPAEGWENQDAYIKILGQTPRIVTASLIAYFAGEFSNSFILAKMKILTQGRWLFTRTIGSTIVGEGVDTIIFCFIAFFGLYSNQLLASIIISNYILKSVEKIDYYDYKTNFNPFIFTE